MILSTSLRLARTSWTRTYGGSLGGQARQCEHSISRHALAAMGTTRSLVQAVENHRRVVDLRSDTVTSPSASMLQTALHARTGDDVMGEDPTVMELEEYVADLTGKECGLFVPTCTMANLIAVLSHCRLSASEIIVGAQSHISLWEAGNVSNAGGVHSRQIEEDAMTAEMPLEAIRDNLWDESDVHCAATALVCLETTHNMMGGVAVSVDYTKAVAALCQPRAIPIHLDGARVWNAAHALDLSVAQVCASVDSVAVCLSKGLGGPLGSVLVGHKEFIRLARRARKRLGGGMRQGGVVAAMGLYGLQHNYNRLADDHGRAQRLAKTLTENGFTVPRNGQVDTNILYFGLPASSRIERAEFCATLQAEHGVLLTGGYSRGGELFRAVTHLDVNDADIDRAAQAMVKVCSA